MNSYVMDWIKTHANWGAVLLFVAGLFSSLIANSVTFPLVLFVAAIGLAVFRYWDAIKGFDFWAFDEWFRTRLDAMGVREWQAPYHAAESYCSSAVVMARNEAAAAMNTIMMDLVKDEGRPNLSASSRPNLPTSSSARRHADYDAAQARFNQCNVMLARELHAQLVRGHLIAKGLLMQTDVAKSERIIPTSRWRVMGLDIAKAEASGPGWSYTGVVIGKKPLVAKKIEQPKARR